MEHHNRGPLADIQMGETKIADSSVGRLEVEIGQIRESLLGCPERFRHRSDTNPAAMAVARRR